MRRLDVPKSLSFDMIIQMVACGQSHSTFLTERGQVFSFGDNQYGQLGIDDRSHKSTNAPLLI